MHGFCIPCHITPPPPANMTLFGAADFQGVRWGLYGTMHARDSLSLRQRVRLHCFFPVTPVRILLLLATKLPQSATHTLVYPGNPCCALLPMI